MREGFAGWTTTWPTARASATTGPARGVSEGEPYPALCHMLDVAAVAEALLACEPLPPWRRDAFALLAFLHDIGKLGPAFRDMLRHGKPQGRYRHWEVSEAILHAHTAELAGRLGMGRAIFKHLRAAVSEHHGKPVALCEPGSDLVRMRQRFDDGTRTAHRQTVALALALWPGASLAGLDATDAQRLSWWFNGLLTAADWIGSNEAWFPRQGWSSDPATHLAAARLRAVEAVDKAGIARQLPMGMAAMVQQPKRCFMKSLIW